MQPQYPIILRRQNWYSYPCILLGGKNICTLLGAECELYQSIHSSSTHSLFISSDLANLTGEKWVSGGLDEVCHGRERGPETAVGKADQCHFCFIKLLWHFWLNESTWPLVSLKNTSTAIYNNAVRSCLYTKQTDIHRITFKPKKGDTMHSHFGSYS